jgi:hypothetical protein
MGIAIAICQAGLAALLIVAGAGKLMQSRDLIDALEATRVPYALASASAVALPVLELILATALLTLRGQLLASTFAATFILLASFTAWLGYVVMRGLQVRCGCFGGSHNVVSPTAIARNGVLLAVALVGCLLAMRASSALPTMSVWLAMLSANVGLALALLTAFDRVRPHLILSDGQLERLAKETSLLDLR